MKQLLSSGEQQGERESFPAEQVKNLFLQQAKQLQRIYPMEISLGEESTEGILQMDKTRILRAWNNLLENAMEYTDRERGIRIFFEMGERRRNYGSRFVILRKIRSERAT